MIARASQLFLPTLRDAPADAEAASHQLLVRGGFIRQIGAGLWAMLPLGWRVHMRIEQIIREEINAIGGQEMRAPTLTPAELWETTGRIDVPILFHLKDSGGRPFVLSWTHEESMTFLAREIQSYKQLPQVWYHFSTKDRDEPRPRGGPPAPARVHHEGLVLVRRRRGRARRSVREARGGVRADLRALRPRGVPRRGGVGGDGRQGVARTSSRRRARARTS